MLTPAIGRAQTTAATISGVVADETQSPVPGANVSVRHLETDTRRELVTDHEGRYYVPALEPGQYEVTVALAGFQTSVRDGILLTLGQHAVINVSMKLGALEERIVVTGSAPLVETSRSGVTGLVEQEQIRELPLNGRDFTQLALLQPGVIAAPTGGSRMVSIAGARPNQISYMLDGADINPQRNEGIGSAAGGQLGVESVREFQVLVNTYSAEYGRSTGGIVSAVTRSGTNTFHAAAFEFHRNDSLEARDYFDPPEAKQPPFKRNQFGGYAGGPLKRDRTFFFASYEGLRQSRTDTTINRVPSPTTRNRPDIHPSIRPYLELYPPPNGAVTGVTGEHIETRETPTEEDYVVAKVDHTFSSRDNLSARVLFDDAAVRTTRPFECTARARTPRRSTSPWSTSGSRRPGC
jgi:hypothetical protein